MTSTKRRNSKTTSARPRVSPEKSSSPASHQTISSASSAPTASQSRREKGKLAFTYADGHTETYEEGDAYYAPPGHTPQLFAGSEVVEFHPTEELAKTMEVVEKNMEAMSQ